MFPLAHGAYLLAVRSISRPQHKWRLTQAEQQSAALALQATSACRSETESIKAALTSDPDPYRLLVRAMLLWRTLSRLSEPFVVSQSDCYPIAKRIQKIVFSFVVLVAYSKAFDLVAEVIALFAFVNCSLVEGITIAPQLALAATADVVRGRDLEVPLWSERAKEFNQVALLLAG